MKKMLLVAAIALMTAAGLGAQSLTPIGNDLTVFFEEIGKDVLPHLQQVVLTGDGFGAASMGDSKFYISHSTGAVLSNGILGFIEPTNSRFSDLNVYGLIDTVVSESSGMSKLYSGMKEFFPYPSFRLAVGFKPVFDIETIFTFSIWPQFVTGWITGLVGAEEIEQLELSTLTAGLKLRRALLEGTGPFPTISVAVGYCFTRFHFAFAFPADFSQDYSLLTLTLGGTPRLDFLVHTAGVEFTVSKRFGFVEPFFKVAGWYQWASYDAAIDGFVAVLKDSGGAEVTSAATEGIDPSAELGISDLSLLLSAGLEMGRKRFRFVPGCSFDLSTSTFAASVVFRLQF